MRDEMLNMELSLSLEEAKYVSDRWRLDYNHHLPHSVLDWMAPAAISASWPAAVAGQGCAAGGSAAPRPLPHTPNATETLTPSGT
ncbi:MAG: transposase [Planctomycetes bacterium]|nr:transposase [Planctomycetota bacterium]